MKKTLSVVLTSAMALSMFSSVAFGKTSADFTDLKDLDAATKAKFDAMITAGIFDGVTDTNFGLKDEMNRAQFAKVAALIMGLEVNKDLKTSTFTDVSVTDAANGYALPYIEALKTAGVTDGYADGMYNPAGKVTKEQLATFLVRVLGQDAAAKGKTGTDATVSGWAQGYVALALELKLLPAGADGKFGGMANATRDLLVSGAYEAKQQYVPAGKVSVTGVKATGAKKLTLTFNTAIDASKVTLSVNKGAATIALASTDSAKWSDDKKSVVLTTDSKLTAGTYTTKVEAAAANNGITLGDKVSADVTVTDETISKVEFLTTSDVVAKSAANTITFKATNQYGEVSDLSATGFQIVLSAGSYTASGDKQQFTFNTSTLTKDQSVAVTVIAPNASAQATKVLKVGDQPSVSKLELGDVTLATGKDRLTAGDSATIALIAYDQYGNKVDDQTAISSSVTLISTNTSAIATSGLSINSDKNLAITTLGTITNDVEVTLTVVANGSGQSVSKVVKVYAPKAAYDVSFGSYTDTIAKDDGTVYLPLVVKDQFGAALSSDEIVTAYNNNKLTVYGSNASVITNVGIETAAGDNKGKVKFDTSTSTGSANVTVLVNTSGKSATNSVSVQDARTPQTIVVDTDNEPTGKILPGANTGVKFFVKDQYGKKITNDFSSAYKVIFALEKVSGDDNGATFNHVGDETQVYTNVSNGGTTYTVSANGGYGVYKLTAKLQKADGTTLSTATRNVETVKAEAADALTYDVTAVGSIFKSPIAAKETKQVKVTAKDSAGIKVALPATVVQGVYSSDTNIASVTGDSTNGFFVGGVAKGDVTLTVTYAPQPGNIKIATQKVTVSDVAPVAETVTVANATKSILASALNGKNVYDAALAGDVKIKDTYGIELSNADLVTYAAHTQVQYILSNVKWSDGADGSLTVNPANGLIAYSATTGKVNSFTITVVALSNGKTSTSNIVVN
jgi:methionine-rich copper-binding protein CopC